MQEFHSKTVSTRACTLTRGRCWLTAVGTMRRDVAGHVRSHAPRPSARTRAWLMAHVGRGRCISVKRSRKWFVSPVFPGETRNGSTISENHIYGFRFPWARTLRRTRRKKNASPSQDVKSRVQGSSFHKEAIYIIYVCKQIYRVNSFLCRCERGESVRRDRCTVAW